MTSLPAAATPRPGPPGAVVAGAVIGFVLAGIYGLGVIAGGVVVWVGVAGLSLTWEPGPPLQLVHPAPEPVVIGLGIMAFFLALALLLVVGAACLLQRRRRWYPVVLAVLGLGAVAGTAASAVLLAAGAGQFFVLLAWPALNVAALVLLTALPGARAWMTARQTGSASGSLSKSGTSTR